jgi:hypothetical protein
LFSRGVVLFSRGVVLFSRGVVLFSRGVVLFSRGVVLFSRGAAVVNSQGRQPLDEERDFFPESPEGAAVARLLPLLRSFRKPSSTSFPGADAPGY